jgi:hypothetical protein
MSSARQDDPEGGKNDAASRQVINSIRATALEAESQYYDELAARGTASQHTKAQLRAAVPKYLKALRPYRDHDAIAEDWQKHKLNKWNRRLHRNEQVTRSVPGKSNRKRSESMPALATLPPGEAINLIDVMEDMMESLGFVVEPDAEADPINPEPW